MIANHIHDALSQVDRLQQFILERNQFKGYSGKARVASGAAALLGAIVMGSSAYPASDFAHLAGWGAVLFCGLLLNYVSLLYWFLFDRQVRRNPAMLKPAMDAIPALGLGAVLSAALILRENYDLLTGCWMAIYGLAQVAYRKSLPHGIYHVGVLYMLAGAFFLLLPGTQFINPWPMGCIFFCGEIAGGWILIKDHMQTESRRNKEGNDA